MHRYQNISIDKAREIIESGSCAVFDIRDNNSFEQGRIPGAQRFSEKIIRSMRKSEQRDSPVLIYCYHGNSSKDIAQMLCDFGFSNVYNLDGGYTAWQRAQEQNTALLRSRMPVPADVYTWLIDQGIHPGHINQRIDNGMTALMRACQFGMAGTINILLRAGADVNLVNDDGNNALWLACFSGDRRAIEALLDNGVDIDNQNVTGATALIYAASAGKADVVYHLLEAGANPHIRTLDDFTALDLAASPSTYKILKNR
ncbi:MAG: ankyrin repeat domain-containing protein [Gammaproteobacteria bacterium]|jgi:ankyrin repeat protein